MDLGCEAEELMNREENRKTESKPN